MMNEEHNTMIQLIHVWSTQMAAYLGLYCFTQMHNIWIVLVKCFYLGSQEFIDEL